MVDPFHHLCPCQQETETQGVWCWSLDSGFAPSWPGVWWQNGSHRAHGKPQLYISHLSFFSSGGTGLPGSAVLLEIALLSLAPLHGPPKRAPESERSADVSPKARGVLGGIQ